MQLHLRRVGVEARPDLVRGIPKDGTGGSHSEKKDGKEDPDDQPKDDGGSSETSLGENQLSPAPATSGSHRLDDQLLSNAKVCDIDQGDTVRLCELLKKQHIIATEILLQFTLEIFVHYLPLLCGILVQYLKLLSETETIAVK